jgi:hypothetical protein
MTGCLLFWLMFIEQSGLLPQADPSVSFVSLVALSTSTDSFPHDLDSSPSIVQPTVPSPWLEYLTDDGYPYYFNPHTQETVWERP